jgi:4-hydroxybutyryl-CoA dehydratase/vinylacetyl-CoA-Delta-isomerase
MVFLTEVRMALRTAEEYRESLKKMRPNIHKFGRLIEDVTTHPATKLTIAGHAQIFEKQNQEEYKELLTTTSHLTGEPISRYLSIIQSAEDMMNNCRLKREMFHLTGTCTGGRCVGWTSTNAMWATTYDMDQKLGSDYHQRLKAWLEEAQRRDITVAGALTDPKGDRTKPPSAQKDPDMNLRLVEKRGDGIVVRGAKVMICGVAAANEIFVLPGSGYRETDKDWAVSFVIPRDIEGLTIVETRRASDTREEEEGWDIPNKLGGITQAYLFLDDVFVPKKRVFMAGEYEFSLPAVLNFIMAYRSAIGSCVAGQGDVKVGAAVLVARANGLSSRVFSDKLIKMYINNETSFATGIAASALGKKHPSGVWQPDPLLANVTKVHTATLPYETSMLAQDIAGGIGETGCIPSWVDFQNPQYGQLLHKYTKAAVSGEARTRAARLVEWATLGPGVPGCMHGGGSPDGAKLVIRANANLEKSVEIAKRLAGIREDIPEPQKKK